MRKTLLSLAIAILSVVAVNAQTVWNFSNAPFGANSIVGGSAAIDFSKNYTTSDGLTIGTDGTVVWTGINANAKTIDGTAYAYRIQCGGGGAPVAPSKIPTTRYFKFNVSGSSTISVGATTSSTGAARTIIVVNDDQSVIDSITNVNAVATYSYSYTGKASTIYLYSRASGINYYYLSATNVVLAGVNRVLADKGISFNGSEIKNDNHLDIEVYNDAIHFRCKRSQA